LRQMDKQNIKCNCLRCREVKFQNYNPKDIKFKIDKFDASYGTEYFLSYTSHDEHVLYGYLRLRLNSSNYGVLPILHDTALIRELHVLGMQVSVNNTQNNINSTQHKKLGMKLMLNAEFIALTYKYKKISVISGVGVRDYYRKKGYALVETYMIKTFTWKYTFYIISFIMYELLFNIYYLISIIRFLFKI